MLGMTRWNSIDSPSFQVTPTNDAGAARYEQSFTVPQFLDLEKISASSHAASTLKASQTRDRSRRPRNTLVLM